MAQKRSIPMKAFDINARWTAQNPVHGWRHYRISSRKVQSLEEVLPLEEQDKKSKKKKEIMVEMMAVCDRQVRFWLARRHVIEDENWQTGWLDGRP